MTTISTTASASQNIRVLTEHLPPFQHKTNQGTPVGYSVDVIKALFAQTQDQANIQLLNWDKAYNLALKDPNIMIFSIARTHEREGKFHWLGNLWQERVHIWGLKQDFNRSFDNIEQLQDFWLVTVSNSSADHYLLSSFQ